MLERTNRMKILSWPSLRKLFLHLYICKPVTFYILSYYQPYWESVYDILIPLFCLIFSCTLVIWGTNSFHWCPYHLKLSSMGVLNGVQSQSGTGPALSTLWRRRKQLKKVSICWAILNHADEAPSCNSILHLPFPENISATRRMEGGDGCHRKDLLLVR